MSQSSEWLGLRGSVVAVTGAAGGIGRAIVEGFLTAGAVVAAIDRDESACREAIGSDAETAGRAVAIGCDVSDEQSVERAAERAAALGRPSILVNNAAVLEGGPLLDVDLAVWQRVLSVNLTGYLLCARAFGRRMRESGSGTMVHVASIGGVLPQHGSGAYSVSKAGVRMLSRSLSLELGQYDIRSNVVSPAMVVTPMSAASYADPKLRAYREALVPSRRIGLAKDIAEAVIWLASPRSSYVNGQEIHVDGGLQAGLLHSATRSAR